jgi:hypothetical protein
MFKRLHSNQNICGCVGGGKVRAYFFNYLTNKKENSMKKIDMIRTIVKALHIMDKEPTDEHKHVKKLMHWRKSELERSYEIAKNILHNRELLKRSTDHQNE